MVQRQPSLAEYEDWLEHGPAGVWPSRLDEPQPLSPLQSKIVARNAALLKEPMAWSARVERFNAAIGAYGNDAQEIGLLNEYCIHFDQHVFPRGDTDFRNLEFPCRVSFDGASFEGGDVDFGKSRFIKGAGFERALFDGQFVSFAGVTVDGGNVLFTGAKFKGNILSFSGMSVSPGVLVFARATFDVRYLEFERSNYERVFVNFREAKFSDCLLNFADSQFGHAGITLSDAILVKSHLGMANVVVDGDLDCRGMVAKSASFFNGTVGGVTDFSGATFLNAPDLRHAKLDRAPEVARMRVPEPAMVHIISEKEQKKRGLPKRDFWQQVAADGNDVHKLRKLKAMAIAASDHEKDGEFFAYEMMAKRGTEHTTFWQLLFNTIYWKVSFYGQSYLRPLAWSGASFATFAAIYSLMAALPISGWQSLAFGITYSFKNSLPFLGTLTRSVPSPEGHVSWFALQLQAIKDAQPGPDWFTVLGTGQAMLSLFFFFFLLLGLRNKFRLK